MDLRDIALALAGLIGGGVALVHGVVVQRLMVKPLEALLAGEKRVSGPIRRLVAPLLHLSTISWLLGGIVLIIAATWFGKEARLATGLFVGSLFLFGAVVNLWATRGRHPGWMLMAASVLLILFGLAD